MTKVRSVVVTTLVLGTNSAGRGLRTGHLTLGYMPGASVPSRFDDVQFDRHGAGLLIERVRDAGDGCRSKCGPGYAGTLKSTCRAARRFRPRLPRARAPPPQMRNLLDHQQRGVGARAHQRAGMHQAVGDHAVERRGDLQVRLHGLRARSRRIAPRRWPAGASAPGPARPPLASAPGPARCRRRLRASSAAFCSALVGALGGGELRFGLQPVRLGRLHLGFRFGDLRFHFGRAQARPAARLP